MSVATYTADLFTASRVNSQVVAPRSPVSPIPSWELSKPNFDIDYTPLIKNENPNILSSVVKSHIEANYMNHLKVFTDGSVLDNRQAGAAFVIPALKIQKSYFLGKDFSIFTAELYAIIMALKYLIDFPHTVFQVVFCVDSKSVLQTLNSSNANTRAEMVLEIKHLVHYLILRGTDINFCWVPSHCGIFANDWVDREAKKGAKNDDNSVTVKSFPPSIQEGYRLLEKEASIKFLQSTLYKSTISPFKKRHIESSFNLTLTSHFNQRLFTSLVFRFRLNALKTKYCQNVKCICGHNLDITHILFQCQPLRQFLPQSFIALSLQESQLSEILDNIVILSNIIRSLLKSPISSLL